MLQLPNSSYGSTAPYPTTAMAPQAQTAQAAATPTAPSPYAPPMANSYSPSAYANTGGNSYQQMFGFMKNLLTNFFKTYSNGDANAAPATKGYEQYWKDYQNRGPVDGFEKPSAGYETPKSDKPSTGYEAPKSDKPKSDDMEMEHPRSPRAPHSPHAPNVPYTPKPSGETPVKPGEGPIKPGEGPVKPGENIPENMRDIETNYRSLTTEQRVELSKLSPEELGLLHAGGRGLSFTGSREGIYMSYWTTLDNLRDGKPVSERDKAAVLEAQAMDEKNKLPSGTSFERNYLSTLDKLTGTKEFTKVLEGAEVVKDTGKRLQLPDNLNPASKEFIEFQKQQGNTNANYGNLMVITQWNHDLLDDGVINGSMSAHELASMQKGTSLVEGQDSKQFLNALLEHEMVDGQFNNSNGEFFLQAFNSAYTKNVKPVELADIEAATKSQSAEAGVTLEKVRQVAKATVNNFLEGGKEGFSKGIQDHAKAMVEKPGSVAANAGNMALSAVCPYVAGLGSVVSNANSTKKA
jgi:hypothetical protein